MEESLAASVAVVPSFFFETNGYDESFYGVGYQDLDLARRLEALVEHGLWKDIVPAPSIKQRCHETKGYLFMLEFEIRDSSCSIPHDPVKKVRSDGSRPDK